MTTLCHDHAVRAQAGSIDGPCGPGSSSWTTPVGDVTCDVFVRPDRAAAFAAWAGHAGSGQIGDCRPFTYPAHPGTDAT